MTNACEEGLDQLRFAELAVLSCIKNPLNEDEADRDTLPVLPSKDSETPVVEDETPPACDGGPQLGAPLGYPRTAMLKRKTANPAPII